MQSTRKCFALPPLLALVLCSALSAQSAGRIESMKLLTTDTGWASTGSKLFWTTDGGASWKDVTPKLNHKRQMVTSVFFLDSSTGWVLLGCADDRDPVADEGCLALSYTTDAGETWSVQQEKIKVPFSREYLKDSTGFSGRSWLRFVDSEHGWELLEIATHAGIPRQGEMLRTADGGRTWVPIKGLPAADHFVFTNAKDGWIAGGDRGELFATHDAGDSWQKVELAVPKGIPPDLTPVYGLPVFVDADSGYLPVTYEASTSSGTPVALFATADGGKTWHPTAKTDALSDAHPWSPYPSSIVGGELLVAAASNGHVDLTRIVRGTGPKTQSARLPVRASIVDQLSFPSSQRGWILASYWLLSTDDGGISWTDVTPFPKLTVPPLASMISGPRHAAPESPPDTSNVSTHLGFDTWPTPPQSAMQTWSTAGSFYDVGIYLYGSANKSTNKSYYPTSSWLSAIEGYGWGVIPIWFGLQSPCACLTASNGTCTAAYAHVFSSDPSTDGAEEADQAIAAAQSLGLTVPMIYKDIENYYGPTLCTSAQQAAAGAAVQSYVDGWDSEMHSTANGSGGLSGRCVR
jgi:photosystem II stability/assembly factor-like uncharacterized protein